MSILNNVNLLKIKHNERELLVDVSRIIDLTISIKRNENVNAYGLPEPEINTFRTEGFTGSVKENGSCNCETLNIVPHGNGTHTECIGHITKEAVYITECLKEFNFIAKLITIEPEKDNNGNHVILRSHLQEQLNNSDLSISAVIIRTLPNEIGKLKMKYADSNAAYFSVEAIQFINEAGIKHLLVDLPSVDHENDTGLKAHHEFWQYPDKPAFDKSITEMIFIPDNVKDGYYWLNLMVPAIETDAVPSRVVVYPIKK